MKKKTDSVFDEPHMMNIDSIKTAEKENSENYVDKRDDYERADQSVFNELSTTSELIKTPENAINFKTWLQNGVENTTIMKSLGIMLLLALVAGPFAILGVFYSTTSYSSFFLLNVVIIGPLMEEALKTGSVLMTVEKKPFYFKNSSQIIITSAMGGLLFGVIENLVYFHVYIDNPTDEIIAFRWLVCTSLHVACSIISGMGIRRIWVDVFERMSNPRISLWLPYFFTAFSVHATYNASVTLIEVGKHYIF